MLMIDKLCAGCASGRDTEVSEQPASMTKRTNRLVYVFSSSDAAVPLCDLLSYPNGRRAQREMRTMEATSEPRNLNMVVAA